MQHISRFFSNDGKDSSSDDENIKLTNKKQINQGAINRLNNLLASMNTDSNLTLVKNIQIAKQNRNDKGITNEKLGKKDNVRNIETLKAESELLSKLLNTSNHNEDHKVDNISGINLQ